MDTISLIIENAIDSSKENAEILIKALDETQIFRGKENVLNYSVGRINALLQSHSTKRNGFELILNLLPQMGSEVLDEKGLQWLTTAIKTCNQQSPSNAVCSAYKVIQELIRHSANATDFIKTVTHSVLQKIIEACGKAQTETEIEALNCIIECVLTFPGPCGPSKAIVEEISMKFVDATDKAVVTRAGNCLFLLQSTKSGGEQGQLHRKYYVDYQLQLINAIHQQFDELFRFFDETTERELKDPDTKLKLPELITSQAPVERISRIIQRVSNLLDFLKISLVAPYPVAKIVQTNQILALIKRGLAVNAKIIIKNAVVENLIAGVLLPQVHVDLYSTLNSLLTVCKGNMRLFCGQILDFYESSFRWTCSGQSIGCKKPYTAIRIATYQSLKLFIDLLGRSSLAEDITETLILATINDTQPFKNEVKLQVQMDGGRHLSKRAKKKLIKAQNESTNLAQSHASHQLKNIKTHHSDEGNVDLCVAALETLISFMEAINCLLKPSQIRTIQQHVVQQCLTIQINSQNRDHLYYSPKSRRALLKTLSALTVNPSPLAPPPTQYVLSLLAENASADVDAAIRELCQTQIMILGKSLRPQKQSLFFEVNQEELENVVLTLRKETLPREILDAESKVKRPRLDSDVIEIMEIEKSPETLPEQNGIEEREEEKSEDDDLQMDTEIKTVSQLESEESEHEEEEPLKAPQEISVIDVDASEASEVEIVEEEIVEAENAEKLPPTDVDQQVNELLEDFVPE